MPLLDSGTQVYDNKDYTRIHVLGVDFNTGSFSHSFRYSYLKFQNQIVDVTSGNNALPDLASTGLEIGDRPVLVWDQTCWRHRALPRQNNQLKYDGSKVLRSHTIRYGVSYNHIQGGGFADFFGTAPRVRFSMSVDELRALGSGIVSLISRTAGPYPGGSANPLN